jgi:hypothetical protein
MRTLLMLGFVFLVISILPVLLFAQKQATKNDASEIDISYMRITRHPSLPSMYGTMLVRRMKNRVKPVLHIYSNI